MMVTFLCLSVNKTSKERRLETVVATFYSSYKEGNRTYVVVQRNNTTGKESWLISKEDLARLTEKRNYEFQITGYPGGISIIDVNTSD